MESVDLMPPRQPATDAATRATALRLAEEHGAAEASRRTGVPAGTIRAWRHRSGEAGPPAGVDPQSWAERKAQGAEDAWQAAQAALRKVHELLAAGKTGDAQRAALTMAITLDKSAMLEAAAQAAQEGQVRLAEADAQRIYAVLKSYFDATGLTFTPAARRVLRDLLCQAGTGDELSRPAAAEDAAREIREQIGSELQIARLQLNGRDDDGPRALPAPSDP
jgi:hypothetical protein